jgi:predicted ester cyclase
LRRRCGWTQKDAAEKSGYTDRLVRKLESGGPIERRTLENVIEAYPEELGDMISAADYVVFHSRDEIIALVTRWLDTVFNQRDMSIVDEMVHLDVVLTADGETRQGRDVIRNRIQAFLDAFDPINLTMERLMVDGDSVVAHWEAKKKHVGEFNGIEPTGKWVILKGSSWAKFQAGKLIEGRDHWDVHDLIQKLTDGDSSSF